MTESPLRLVSDINAFFPVGKAALASEFRPAIRPPAQSSQVKGIGCESSCDGGLSGVREFDQDAGLMSGRNIHDADRTVPGLPDTAVVSSVRLVPRVPVRVLNERRVLPNVPGQVGGAHR